MPTMRERFVRVSSELVDTNPDLAIVLADIGVAQFEATGVIERHPDRVVNVGIREQLLVSFAAGMAKEGLRPIVHTYAPFLIERPFEQLKLDLTHQAQGAVLVSVGASYDNASSGRTHQTPEDIALLSTLPEWRLHVPGHPDEVETLLRAEAGRTGCAYIRLAERSNSVSVSSAAGRFSTVRDGSSSAPVIIAIGPMLDPVLAATGDLDVTILYAATVRPFDDESLRQALGETTDVVLVEPYLEGTSAQEVSRALRASPHRLLSIGVARMEHRHYGTSEQHDAAHGLDAAGIRARLDEFLTAPLPV